ncbi:phosphoribosyl-AMP cyclohydrolase [Erythrobacter rubeus]|uniref:Phosphoribosyl-AMP cyclohydrolase n=1 Tax=Erythrobacter rubeus TaxID=2760803 RepID=A0ABR8KQT8_9SPHN|nr:phosphoribosyl-AMP cyclohydrolase [Erythrobacter rubeus]MBD2840814.1 phosphoribosyl-AMP cyclohydrolase [Erythrobacter rubeus]
MKKTIKTAIGLAAVSALAAPALANTTPITTEEVEAAQKEWGEGIVAISAAHANGGDYEERAREHLDTLYNYDNGTVLFKPTLAAEDQFRGTYEEALSYFVKGMRAEDSGFAIKGWTDVRFENEGIVTDDDNAMAMGNYFFTLPDGSVTKVEYTFGYVRGPDGELKINTHHSSMPFQPTTVSSAN